MDNKKLLISLLNKLEQQRPIEVDQIVEVASNNYLNETDYNIVIKEGNASTEEIANYLNEMLKTNSQINRADHVDKIVRVWMKK
ncbi:hypothetical protein WJR50_30800 [Catalinimonas sp. 4WD22]|uniref:hypothetical protein n=1 Tax=Catalinimonas locisalis TaxID=3133978 RepID=UPI0031013DC8